MAPLMTSGSVARRAARLQALVT